MERKVLIIINALAQAWLDSILRQLIACGTFYVRFAVTTLVAVIISLGNSSALEVDCRACDFCKGRRDLASEIDARILEHIRNGETAAEIASVEGGSSIFHSPIEEWAERHPESVRPAARLLKYRGSKIISIPFFSAYSSCCIVNGVCIGTDKLGHMFQQGWESYLIAVRDGKSEEVAREYGEWLEGEKPREFYAAHEAYFRNQFAGKQVGYGGFGRNISGVISRADVAASLAGLQMYRDIAAGRFTSITNYVTKMFCEEVNTNDYTPELKLIVDRNLKETWK